MLLTSSSQQFNIQPKEHKMKNYRNGEVAYYDPTKRSGNMRLSGGTEYIPFVLSRQRPFIAGFREPVFGCECETKIPSVGSKVIVSLAFTSQRETTKSRHSLVRRTEVVEWGFATSYDMAARVISTRPKYEVVEYVFYDGKPVSVNQRRVINFGTAIQLQATYPRGVVKDPLAAEYSFLGFTYRRRFYLLEDAFLEGTKRTQCPDPRPSPTAEVAPFQPTNEEGTLLATIQQVLSLPQIARQKQQRQSELVVA
ncbi:MAG TPA: hypothetical protein VJZ94_02750 [Candidatus Paceibacterota bacterium]|uniref:Uncharacterized protein n=1 Tax=Candidatus Taylorbacteria bacterium RIFCSPHIGHO2_02_FULL_46_13 TaxID=1802312 RepID=A0A1G2MT35_9BACT|nr:MAG: hypothetical protein A3C06_01660 [Candidatus Taylorbacteria bacterium RIFCSPHIGHO2_02_FULL_46_13]HXK31628.1 hypothetical protein [Candidatus Paceibacterota bacterium]